jgi:TRAP-type uncharacterized transport system substrate-binding protein
MYDTPFQPTVLRRCGITSIAQLDKKRVGIGPRGGTSGTYVPAIVKALGISAEISNGPRELVANDLLAGRYAAYLAMLGTPTPAIQNVEASEPITFISLSSEQIEAVRKAIPELSVSKVVAGTYHRRLDRWQAFSENACAVSDVRYALSGNRIAAIGHHEL